MKTITALILFVSAVLISVNDYTTEPERETIRAEHEQGVLLGEMLSDWIKETKPTEPLTPKEIDSKLQEFKLQISQLRK